jgi:mRNA interferase RelE/StbE
MGTFRVAIPPALAEEIRHFPPELKKAVKEALKVIGEDPFCGVPLVRELKGLQKFRVNRFRIVYQTDPTRRLVMILSVGHRKTVYEETAERMKRKR